MIDKQCCIKMALFKWLRHGLERKAQDSGGKSEPRQTPQWGDSRIRPREVSGCSKKQQPRLTALLK
jgi:hypothetical protein